jgi:NAD(P)-dependent dehydrogenase (short-subunit alcohol dehydrogenase family)
MPGSRVLVAGALGGACVELLARTGQRVVGVDRVAREPAAAATAPPAVHAVDITVPGGAERAVELAAAILGGLDGIVHAVGMSGRRLGDGPVTGCTDAAWAEVCASTSSRRSGCCAPGFRRWSAPAAARSWPSARCSPTPPTGTS